MAKTATKTPAKAKAKVASKGLARANEIYQNRDQRAKELKAEGRIVMGYLCTYPVLELMTALDIVPYRLFGDMRETITKADTYMGTVICSFLRSTLDIALKGRDDFLDGAVFAHTCDEGCALNDIWRATIELPYTYFIDTPSTVLERGQRQEKALLKEFQTSLEEFTGKKATPAKIKKAIKLHNQQRALLRELYDLRKPDPPLISAVETLKVMKAVQSIPIEEGNQLVSEVITEVKERKTGRPTKKTGRLLVWGPVIDDTSFVEMIESLDANLVMDDTCVGTRAFFDDVKLTDDPLEGLAYHYLVDIQCPRTFREPVLGPDCKDHIEDIEFRYGYLGKYAKDWNCNGVIMEWMRYCDSHGYEVPALNDYLDHIGLPHLGLEQDYSEAALAPMRTRVQGFLEVIS